MDAAQKRRERNARYYAKRKTLKTVKTLSDDSKTPVKTAIKTPEERLEAISKTLDEISRRLGVLEAGREL